MSEPFPPVMVLDAWAVLAFLQGEQPAADRVREALENAQDGSLRLLISIINLGEVYYRIGKAHGQTEAEEAISSLRLLPLEILPSDEQAVFTAARFKIQYPISYADAFVAGAAKQFQATILTGDVELFQLDSVIPIVKLQRS